MRRALFIAGIAAGGAALVLLALDPTRDLAPIAALLAVAVVLVRASFLNNLRFGAPSLRAIIDKE